MNKILVGIIAVFGMAIGYLLYKDFAQRKELAFININKLATGYKGMKDIQKELEEKSKVWKANVDTLGSELENDIKVYEKERARMSAKEIKLKEEILRNKQQQFLQYQEAIQQKITEEDKKLKERVLNNINEFLKEYGEMHQYNFILGATNIGNLVYANSAYDITDKVLEGLNKQYKSE
jgi:outer membrane protein